MKKLLSKVFFASDCAKGAAFAFTLFTAGNWLWFSFFHLLALCLGKYGRLLLPLFICSVVGALLIMLYSLALAVISLVGLVKVLRRERRFKALWYLVPAGVCLALGAVGVIRFFPPWNVLTCYSDPGSIGPLPEWMCGGLPGVTPMYWALCFFIALLFFVAGGLFMAAAFAAAGGKKIRYAFGAATLSVWGVFALWYISTLGLAYRESRACSAVRQAVEKRFGRPLTAAGLGQLYHESGKIDAEFWSRQEKLRDVLRRVKIDRKYADGDVWTEEFVFANITLPDRPSEATLAWYAEYCRSNHTAVDAYERCFDREPPLPEKRFVRGDLLGEPLPTIMQSRAFVRFFERSRLIYFLSVKDADAAWSCYRRMRNVGAYLQKETFLICSLGWLRIEQGRLDCMEKLLESRLLPDAKLDELDADLAALERDIPRVHERAMYSEAVFGQDIIFGLEEGLLPLTQPIGKLIIADDNYRRELFYPGAFAPYRWIFPVGWYHAARDKRNLLQAFLVPDLRHVPKGSGNEFYFISKPFILIAGSSGDIFYALTARTRGMRALIRAEKYRRKHGKFPKTLSNLPEDPFTGKPLVYEVGKAKITETVWEAPVRPVENTVKTTVDAVSVRSLATLPRSLRREEEDHYEDATRAMIRY